MRCSEPGHRVQVAIHASRGPGRWVVRRQPAMRLILLILALGLLPGCMPWPHTTDRSQEVRGRVLDANTHTPVSGAKVFLVQSPHHPAYTDATGHFRLKATRNFHWAYPAPEGHWPDRKDSSMEIAHPDYLSIWGNWSGDVGDVLLKPKQ